MAMTVTYSVVPRKNPAKRMSRQSITRRHRLRESWILKSCAKESPVGLPVRETDVRAAISGILYEAKRALKAGRIVRLGDLGSLQIGLNSEGAVSVKEFSSSLITAAHIIFVPERRWRTSRRFLATSR